MPTILNPEGWLYDLAHGNDEARHHATRAIGSLSSGRQIDIAPFVAALSSTDEKLVFWSVIGLGRAQSQAEQAILSLASLAVNHPAFGIRQAAISSLRQIAPGNPSSRLAAIEALKDCNALVRREALQSIASFSSPTQSEIEKVRVLAADPDDVVVNWCGIVLRHHGQVL